MKALQVVQPGEVEIAEKNDAVLKSKEARVKIHRVGICGSDIHIYEGSNPFTIYPRVIGHEMAGEILETAEDLTGYAPGDKVVIDPVLNCGECDTCLRGHPNVCSNLKVIGVHTDGGFADRITVPAENLYKIPSSMDWDRAVLVEPFSIGANVCDRMKVEKNDRVLIIGSGVIGNTVLMIAKMLGAEVISCDIEEKKLIRARELGADYTINSREQTLKDAVMEMTKGEGATVVIDAACIPSMFQSLLECAAPGGNVGILGFSQNISEVCQFEITRKELTIVGSRLNNRMFPRVIEWFGGGRLVPEKIIDKVYPFHEAEKVLKEVAQSDSMEGKTIISFS